MNDEDFGHASSEGLGAGVQDVLAARHKKAAAKAAPAPTPAKAAPKVVPQYADAPYSAVGEGTEA